MAKKTVTKKKKVKKVTKSSSPKSAAKKKQAGPKWGTMKKVSYKSAGLLKAAATLTFTTSIF